MASNNPSGYWSVKVLSIPESITQHQLAKIVGFPTSRVYVPKKSSDRHYAWINDFIDEEEANKFANQWSGSKILDETIKCIVSERRSDKKATLHSFHGSLVSGIANTLSDNSTSVTIPVPPTSVNRGRTPDIAANEDDRTSIKQSRPRHSHRNRNSLLQGHTIDKRSPEAETSSRLLYRNNQLSLAPNSAKGPLVT